METAPNGERRADAPTKVGGEFKRIFGEKIEKFEMLRNNFRENQQRLVLRVMKLRGAGG